MTVSYERGRCAGAIHADSVISSSTSLRSMSGTESALNWLMSTPPSCNVGAPVTSQATPVAGSAKRPSTSSLRGSHRRCPSLKGSSWAQALEASTVAAMRMAGKSVM